MKIVNNKFTISLILLLSTLVIGVGCVEDDTLQTDCIRGKYLGNYCEGAVVQILGEHKIGRDWKSMFSDEVYTNSVVASIDTLMAKDLDPDFFSTGAEFHFKYRDGGYGRKQFSVCEPSAFIIITFVSKIPMSSCY